MKYLKKLETTAEYEAYKNSEEFVKPNITLISTEHKTHMTVGDDYELFETNDGTFIASDGIFITLK